MPVFEHARTEAPKLSVRFVIQFLQERITNENPAVVILSGGPNSVHEKGSPNVAEGFWQYIESKSIPVLGICYGMQLIVHHFGGKVEKAQAAEYGRMAILKEKGAKLYAYGDEKEVSTITPRYRPLKKWITLPCRYWCTAPYNFRDRFSMH